MSEFKSPCPASECDRTIPCRPPAPACPHPWHAATKARIAARPAEIRSRQHAPTTTHAEDTEATTKESDRG